MDATFHPILVKIGTKYHIQCLLRAGLQRVCHSCWAYAKKGYKKALYVTLTNLNSWAICLRSLWDQVLGGLHAEASHDSWPAHEIFWLLSKQLNSIVRINSLLSESHGSRGVLRKGKQERTHYAFWRQLKKAGGWGMLGFLMGWGTLPCSLSIALSCCRFWILSLDNVVHRQNWP